MAEKCVFKLYTYIYILQAHREDTPSVIQVVHFFNTNYFFSNKFNRLMVDHSIYKTRHIINELPINHIWFQEYFYTLLSENLHKFKTY